MHSSRIRNIVNTILILTGLVLLIIFGGKAASQATNWQAVNGKRHSLPSPANMATTAFIINDQPGQDAQVQPVAISQSAVETATQNNTTASDHGKTEISQPEADQPAATPDNENSMKPSVPSHSHKSSQPDN